jgi:transposase
MNLLDGPEPDGPAILSLLAWSTLCLGEAQRGLDLAEEAERTIRERQMLLYLPEAMRIQGMALTQVGRVGEAETVLTKGLERARGMPLPYTEARILTELGLLACREGQNRQATELLVDASAIFRRLGAAKDVERTAVLLTALSQNSSGTVSQNSSASLPQDSSVALPQRSESGAVRLTDAQWDRIAALLPPRRPGRGRPRADDRQTLEAILYVQRTGCAWADLPAELGNDATAHRRWQEWQAAGLWEQIAALAEMPGSGAGEKQQAGDADTVPTE